MVLMSTSSVGEGKGGLAGEFIKAFLSAGTGLEKKIRLWAARPWTLLGSASTLTVTPWQPVESSGQEWQDTFSTSLGCWNSPTVSSQHWDTRESGLHCQVPNMTPTTPSECLRIKLTPRKPREDAFLLIWVIQHTNDPHYVAWQGLLGNIKKPIWWRQLDYLLLQRPRPGKAPGTQTSSCSLSLEESSSIFFPTPLSRPA